MLEIWRSMLQRGAQAIFLRGNFLLQRIAWFSGRLHGRQLSEQVSAEQLRCKQCRSFSRFKYNKSTWRKIRLLLLAQTLRQKTLCEQVRDESSSSEKNDADESKKNAMDLEFHKPEKGADIRLQIRFSKFIASKSVWAYQLKTVL